MKKNALSNPENGALAILVLAYAGAFFLFPTEPDSAQYASIAREMAEGASWLRVQHRGQPYLDKPPWLFWMGAVFFKIFGAHAFAWRLSGLPALIILWFQGSIFFRDWGISYTISHFLRLACFLTPAFWLMFMDLRCELWLTAFCLLAWNTGAAWLRRASKRDLWCSGFFFCGALLSKGMVGAMLIIPGWLVFTFFQKISLKRLSALGLTALFIGAAGTLPYVWGLWKDFGIEGPAFYFWYQSFGRITGENLWNNHPDPFFLWHSALWAWAPISAGGFGMVIWKIRSGKEILWHPAGLLMTMMFLTLFSFSRYQLPHYIFPVAPWAALSLGPWLEKPVKPWCPWVFFVVATGLFLGTVTMLCFLFWREMNFFRKILCILTAFGIPFSLCFRTRLRFSLKALAIFWGALSPALASWVFFPTLGNFDAGKQIGNYVENYGNWPILTYRWSSHQLDFLLKTTVPVFDNSNSLIHAIHYRLAAHPQGLWLAIPEKEWLKINYQLRKIFFCTVCKQFPYFRTTRLTKTFLLPESRPSALQNLLLIFIRNGNSGNKPSQGSIHATFFNFLHSGCLPYLCLSFLHSGILVVG